MSPVITKVKKSLISMQQTILKIEPEEKKNLFHLQLERRSFFTTQESNAVFTIHVQLCKVLRSFGCVFQLTAKLIRHNHSPCHKNVEGARDHSMWGVYQDVHKMIIGYCIPAVTSTNPASGRTLKVQHSRLFLSFKRSYCT